MSVGLKQTAQAERLHVAIIMDGNGRWASLRNLSRAEGHRAGAESIRRIVDAAPRLGVRILTLYAFSGNNWGRPASEVRELMKLFEDFFRTEEDAWVDRGIRVSVIGRRDRLPASLLEAISAVEQATCSGTRLSLRLAIDYSAQAAIMEAARRFCESQPAAREEFSRLLAEVCHASSEDRDVDLIIRTGGEQRLSDFMLWEIAYAELFFSSRYWPDFGEGDLAEALAEYRRRERRFGRLKEPAELVGART
ncbi:MAG TPA: polyprenyl diphosphate synthase [Terriglobia bacterium]|nr:polyprenyl diphosphate synthase [Terriglobia bacterium]